MAFHRRVLTGKLSFKLQFFTWDSIHDSVSWWKHLENELPEISKMGFTQVWLPPPNKAAAKVRV